MLTYEQVLEKLLILETLGLAKDIEKAVIRVWLSLMNAEGVTAQEWGAAISKVARTKTFQVKPVEVLEVVHEIREAARAYALNTVDHVEAFDSRGYMILAPYNRVKDGFLLPNGQTDPSALPPSKIAALPSSTLTVKDREDRIRELVAKGGLIAAAAFVNMIKTQGHDVTVEIQTIQAMKAQVEKAEAEHAENIAAKQAARIRKQVASIKGELVNQSTRKP